MPIAVSPINRKRDLMFRQLSVQSGNQVPVLFVDGALAIEMVVMLRDAQHALARDILPAQYIFQKRDDIRLLLRTAKRNYQDCVVGHRLNHQAGWETLSFQNNSYDCAEKRLQLQLLTVSRHQPNPTHRNLRSSLGFYRTTPPETGPVRSRIRTSARPSMDNSTPG